MNEPQILYCDNHLLCVTKPPGVLSQADMTGDLDLLSWCRSYVEKRFNKPGRAYLGLVHRLDRPASGVMVFARTSKAAARLSRQFRDRTVAKRYFALVEGRLTGSGTAVARIRKSGRGVEEVPNDAAGGMEAELFWRSELLLPSTTLVHVDLSSGRKHQIRFQLSQEHHPIVGDFRYGSTMELDGRNIALHCYSLALDHPTRKVRMSWHSRPPASWPLPSDEFEELYLRLVGGVESGIR
ncbi:MAG: RNA pseudouridine synthase [Rhodothermales bacterium]|nr:RNA pseudouridine synthase [Rhodothermales bacterium]